MNAYQLAEKTGQLLAEKGVALTEGDWIHVLQTIGDVARSELHQGHQVVLLGLGKLVPIKLDQDEAIVRFRASNALKSRSCDSVKESLNETV